MSVLYITLVTVYFKQKFSNNFCILKEFLIFLIKKNKKNHKLMNISPNYKIII